MTIVHHTPIAPCETGSKRFSFKANLLSGIVNGHFNAIQRHQVAVAAVAILSLPISPSAIVRAVSKIVFDAVNHCSLKPTWKHVGSKKFSVVPSFANCNAATSPIFELRAFGIVASGKHVCPSPINGVSVSAAIQSVLGESFPGHFRAVTTAGRAFAHRYASKSNRFYGSAVAFCNRFSVWWRANRDNDKASKTLSDSFRVGDLFLHGQTLT